MQSRIILAVGLTCHILTSASADVSSAARTKPWTFYNKVATCIDPNWKGSERCDYRASRAAVDVEGNPLEAYKIEGDGASFFCSAGIEQTFLVPARFTLAFQYRAISQTDLSSVTNASLMFATERGKVIHEESLVSGGVRDTGWRVFRKTFRLPRSVRLKIVLLTSDAWVQNWDKEVLFAGIEVRSVRASDPPAHRIPFE